MRCGGVATDGLYWLFDDAQDSGRYIDDIGEPDDSGYRSACYGFGKAFFRTANGTDSNPGMLAEDRTDDDDSADWIALRDLGKPDPRCHTAEVRRVCRRRRGRQPRRMSPGVLVRRPSRTRRPTVCIFVFSAEGPRAEVSRRGDERSKSQPFRADVCWV